MAGIPGRYGGATIAVTRWCAQRAMTGVGGFDSIVGIIVETEHPSAGGAPIGYDVVDSRLCILRFVVMLYDRRRVRFARHRIRILSDNHVLRSRIDLTLLVFILVEGSVSVVRREVDAAGIALGEVVPTGAILTIRRACVARGVATAA